MDKSDVLVIGCGVAGCATALELAKQGVQVTLVSTVSDVADSNSSLSQEGLPSFAEPELLKQRIREAGGQMSFDRAVEQLVSEAPSLLEELKLDSGPYVGKQLVERMLAHVATHPNILLLPNHTAIDLITLARHSLKLTDVYKKPTCLGAYVLDNATGKVAPFLAKETVLATGGAGSLFLHATCSVQSRGDGVAMAARAGARVMNLEFVQFQPTTLYRSDCRRLLIEPTEKMQVLKGGGEALEVGSDGMTRSIYEEMQHTGKENLWIDVSRADDLEKRMPLICEFFKNLGQDPKNEPLPIVPAAHYLCGGIAVDRSGQSSMDRLRAVGEVSCTGVHGANRLPAIGLMEGLVWGRKAAQEIGKQIEKFAYYFPEVSEWEKGSQEVPAAQLAQDWSALKQTMWNYVGPVRDDQRLRRALQMLREQKDRLSSVFETAAPTPELCGLRNGVDTALLIAQSAARNTHTLGCHVRTS